VQALLVALVAAAVAAAAAVQPLVALLVVEVVVALVVLVVAVAVPAAVPADHQYRYSIPEQGPCQLAVVHKLAPLVAAVVQVAAAGPPQTPVQLA